MRLMLALLAMGCHSGLKDPTFPTGSSTIVSLDRSLYSVNAWDGTLVWVDTAKETSKELEIGGEPTRIAKVGDTLWVTLRASREVAVFDIDSDGAPVERRRLSVGAEPYGIVASEDGETVYVALSQEDAVIEVDPDRMEVSRRWEVRDEPRWLALHPSGRSLFVIYGFDAKLTRIDLQSGEQQDIRSPKTFLPGSDRGDDTELHGRPTGDPAVSPLGDTLMVPTFFVDSDSAGLQPTLTNGVIEVPPVPYYTSTNGGAGLQLNVSRFNASLIGVPLDKDSGEPLPDDDTLAFFVGGFDGLGNPVRGYISSVTFHPDGAVVYASMESADTVAVVDLAPVDGQGLYPSVSGNDAYALDTGGPGSPPSDGGFYERAQVFITAKGNPAGVTVDKGGKMWLYKRGNREVSWFSPSLYQSHLAGVSNGNPAIADLHPMGRLTAGHSHLPPDVEAGRELFYSSTDSRMAAVGAGVSCSTCHFDSRNDGLTWVFDNNPRQTPSLAGPVGETSPVTWTLSVDTVAREAMITSAGRMGGDGLSPSDASNMEAFINWTRDVDTKDKGRRDTLFIRGAELFQSPSVGCAECHNGPRMTDNKPHDMYGLKKVNTPTLIGIDATAPYLHDGSSPTLRDLLISLRDGSMGSTEGLSDDDLDALEAYLKSL